MARASKKDKTASNSSAAAAFSAIDKLLWKPGSGCSGALDYMEQSSWLLFLRYLDPKVGEKFDDGVRGSAGFICESYGYMREKARNDPKAYAVLQHKTFTGGEVKPLAYVTAQMNCILHGLETPNITFGDTLSNKIAAIYKEIGEVLAV